jgi:hypothetical protein
VDGWWDWHLFGSWVLVNAAAFVVIPVAGAALGQVASTATKRLVDDHRVLATLIVASVGAVVQATVWGRWQWQLLRRRVPQLQRRRWVVATLVPAFGVWLLVLAPQVTDVLAEGGNTLQALRNGFVQALVLGPLIGLSQATAFRSLTSRWAWWLLANVTSYLTGTLLREFAVWLQHELSWPARLPDYFPVAAFAIHGAWMLWVTAPRAVRRSPRRAAEGAAESG